MKFSLGVVKGNGFSPGCPAPPVADGRKAVGEQGIGHRLFIIGAFQSGGEPLSTGIEESDTPGVH